MADQINQPEKTAPSAVVDPTLAAIAELRSDLHLVRNQVDQVQIAADEKKGPWWREKSVFISALALAVSVIFGIYSNIDQFRERRIEDRKQKLASLDSSIAAIVEIKTEEAKQQATLNATAYRTWANIINMKRLMLLATAVDIARAMPKDVSPVNYLTIGNELINDGRYADAKQFLELGIENAIAAKQPPTFLWSSLAQVYLLPRQAFSDLAKGRALYNKAIDSFTNQTDYSALNNKLGLILYWAYYESNLGEHDASARLLATADRVVNECKLPGVGKAPLQRMVDDVHAQLQPQTSSVNLNDMSKWLGTWQLSVNDRIKGELSFLLVPGATYAGFSKTALQDNVLIARQTGTVVVVSPGMIRLEWTGAFATGPNGPFQTAGFSTIELRPDGAFVGHDYQAGSATIAWLARHTSDTSGKRLRAGL